MWWTEHRKKRLIGRVQDKVQDTDEWKWRGTNTMMMKVNTGNNQGALFVVQVDKEWRRSQRYPFHLRVTAVAHKTSLSFCRWCRRQVTNKHTCTVRMWLCMKWRSMVHDCMVHTECADTAPVSCGTSHVTIKQRCPRSTSEDIQKAL